MSPCIPREETARLIVREVVMSLADSPLDFGALVLMATKRWREMMEAAVLKHLDCPECLAYDRIHNSKCPLHPDFDPTPSED